MKLSTKLRLSFAVLIVVPVILFALAIIGLSTFKLREIKVTYNADNASYETLVNPVEYVSNLCKSEYAKLTDAAAGDVSRFYDDVFLDSINKVLRGRNAFLMVEAGGKLTYRGDEEAYVIFKALTDIKFSPKADTGIYLGGEYKRVINAIVFYDRDGVNGTAYIVMNASDWAPQMRRLIVDGIVAIVLVLFITSAIFVTWIYRTTVVPINKLKLATHNIKNGNLDFELKVKGKNEISELCQDFDNMRERLKENAEEKIKSDAANRELISNISHDLKTPITTIKGYVEGIMDGVVDSPEKMEKYIRTIYNKACDMDKLIDELTFYSKIDTNNIPYNFAKISVQDYFDDCVCDIGAELEAEGVSLTYENRLLGETYIYADPEQLKRVINNIVGNSVKYMDKDRKMIAIMLSDCDEWVNISIEDNARGIAKEDIEHIFDRFYRADSSRNLAKGGSGIGLSIVKKIISDHGGMIEATSVLGQGTQMKISLLKFKDTKEPIQRIDNTGGKYHEQNIDS